MSAAYIWARVCSGGLLTPSCWTGNLPLWVMEGERASDREERGGKDREGDRKGVTQTDRKTDRHAVVGLDKLAKVLVNIRL